MKPPLLANGSPKRERFLFMGGYKSGKTSAWLQIAAMHQKRKSKATFYWLDTDFAAETMLAPDGDFGELENVIFEPASDWAEVVAATKMFKGKIKDGDWLVVDMVTPCWEMCYSGWTREVYGEDLDTLLTRKMAEKAVSGKAEKFDPAALADAMRDLISWPAINKRYNPWAQSLISHRGNLILCAAQKELPKKRSETDQEYASWGIKPEANKYTGHLVNDIFWFKRPSADGPPRVQSLGRGKSDGSRLLKGEEISNFALNFLVKRAGWKL